MCLLLKAAVKTIAFKFAFKLLEIKQFRMTRLSVDLVNFTLVETGSAMGIQIYPLRLSTCNLYSAGRCTAECLSSFRKSTRANSWARPVAHHLTIRLQR